MRGWVYQALPGPTRGSGRARAREVGVRKRGPESGYHIFSRAPARSGNPRHG
jgi:hypothetical protein